MENGDLLDFINRRIFLQEPMARMFFKDILAGLCACHDRDIIHRDVKCSNILISANNRLKLADFGFSRLLSECERSRTYCGSLGYAAPEVLHRKPYFGKPADVWSCGVVLYFMVTGELPFDEVTLANICKGPDIPSRISLPCKLLLKEIFAIDPKKRPSIRQIQTHTFMREITSHN